MFLLAASQKTWEGDCGLCAPAPAAAPSGAVLQLSKRTLPRSPKRSANLARLLVRLLRDPEHRQRYRARRIGTRCASPSTSDSLDDKRRHPRDRDTMEQVRVPIAEIKSAVHTSSASDFTLCEPPSDAEYVPRQDPGTPRGCRATRVRWMSSLPQLETFPQRVFRAGVPRPIAGGDHRDKRRSPSKGDLSELDPPSSRPLLTRRGDCLSVSPPGYFGARRATPQCAGGARCRVAQDLRCRP